MSPRWMRRGTWELGRTDGALFAIQLSTLATVTVRGSDYLRGDEEPGKALTALIESAPLQFWGLFFLSASALMIVGMATHHGRVIATGHMVAMAAYATVAYAQLDVVGLGPGFRTPFGFAMAAVIHCALGISIFAVIRRRSLIYENAQQEHAGG